MVQDLVQVNFIDLSVVDSDRKTLCTEPARAPNPMQVVLWVSLLFILSRAHHDRNIKIDNDLNLRNVDAPSEHICSDDYCNFAGPELLNHFVSLLVVHLSENDDHLKTCLPQDVE